MGITKKLIYLFALGIVVTFLLLPLGLHQYGFLFWNLVLAGLLALDILITPNPRGLKLQKENEIHLYFKAENTVAFHVKNTSKHRLKVECADESLRHFAVAGKDLKHHIAPHSEALFAYQVVPSKRGSFSSSTMFMRCVGLLGLCVKYHNHLHFTRYKVYPNIQDLSMYRLIMQKSRLLPSGEKHIRQYGTGAEFESLRPYVEGDDYRNVNWKATARENKLIVNQYQLERDQPVYVLLDTARPMSYTVNGYKKLDYALNAALILSDIVNQQGDKFGIIAFNHEVQCNIPPGQGATHRNHILETLYAVEDNRLTPNYEAAFTELCKKQKRRSLVFIFTDFEIIEEAQDLIAHISILKRKHLPIVVFMENANLNQMAEAEGHTPYDAILQATALEFKGERRGILRKLNAMGIPSIESKAEEFTLSAVNRYLQIAR